MSEDKAGTSHKPHTVFIDGYDPTAAPVRKGVLKLYHRKSKTGCLRCRQRRVKCDEAKPSCKNCRCHDVACVYDRKVSKDTSPAEYPQSQHDTSSPEDTLTDAGSSTQGQDQSLDDVLSSGAESRSRRVLELGLMVHYITKTASSISTDTTSTDVWDTLIPTAAVKFDFLLYAVYAVAALHKSYTETGHNAAEAHILYGRYLDMTIQEQRKTLSDLRKEDLDPLCLASSLLRLCFSDTMRQRPLHPYEPPVEWMEMTHKTRRLFPQAVRQFGQAAVKETVAGRLMLANPIVWDTTLRLGSDKRRGFEHLLERNDDDIRYEPWSGEIQESYEAVLSYIGGIWEEVQNQGPNPEIYRRLILFPMLIEEDYIDNVRECRPRALVMLAHFFALLTMMKDFWYIGDAGPRETRAIAAQVPDRWRGAMQWPLQLLDQDMMR